ncbi:nitrophenyl compound nitroreductase subunit ArsF family protein [Nanoarchaeota archaeon]
MRVLITIVLLVFLAFLAGCAADAEDLQSCAGATCNAVLDTTSNAYEISVDKLEVYHFHGTNQCYSCKTVGAYAEETINTYFKDELESGKIVFGHINVDLVENSALATKYGATGSSLRIGTYKGSGFEAEENVNVWYKIKDKQDYVAYLKGVIEQKLAGN